MSAGSPEGTLPLEGNSDPVISDFTVGLPTLERAGEGDEITASAIFTDADVGDTHNAEIDWGDGTTSSPEVVESGGSGTVQATHVYQVGGIYTVTLTVKDTGDGSQTATATVEVSGVGLHEGVLQILGTDAQDRVGIRRVRGQELRVSASFLTESRSFKLSEVEQIEVMLYDGNDQLNIQPKLDAPAWVDGGPGDDKLRGGSGDDTILGGIGDDKLWGRDGNDLLDGGEGYDRLFGRRGDDVLLGGLDNDYVFGNQGNDVILGGYGDDLLHGHGDRDLIIGGDGADQLKGNAHDDILIAGTTLYDENIEALLEIQAVWTSKDYDYDTRVANLQSPTGPAPLVHGETVLDDEFVDTLGGGGGSNWLLLDTELDVIAGRRGH